MDNFIEIYDNVISEGICNQFIKFFEYQDSISRTVIGKTGGTVLKKTWKDCQDLNIRQGFNDKNHLKILKFYEKLIDEKMLEYFKKYPAFAYSIENPHEGPDYDKISMKSCAEVDSGPLMHRYEPPNQGYHIWHCDWGLWNDLAAHRMIVAMLYLNDVEEGGETEFYHQKVKVKPKQGTLVVWPAYFTHLHRGNAPISNTKYIINKWGFLKKNVSKQ